MADLLRALDVIVTGLMVFVWANLLWAAWATDRDAARRARARVRCSMHAVPDPGCAWCTPGPDTIRVERIGIDRG